MSLFIWTGEAAAMGLAPNDWSVPKNWNPKGPPRNGDDVVIPDADSNGNNPWPVNVDGPKALNSLVVGKIGMEGHGVSVLGTFTWTPGLGGTTTRPIDVDLLLLGTSKIQISDAHNPAVFGNSPHTLTNTGELTIESAVGGQLVLTNNQTLINNKTMTLVASGITGGSPATLRNPGTISCSHSSALLSINLLLPAGSRITIGSGATLSLGAGMSVHFSGGTVEGAGTLSFGAPAFPCEIFVETPTTIKKLTIVDDCALIPPASGSPKTLTVTESFEWAGGSVFLPLVIAAGCKAQVSGTGSLVSSGTLLNKATLTIPTSGSIVCTGGPGGQITNLGAVELQGAARIVGNSGMVTNKGLLRKVDAGVATLGVALMNQGNIVIGSQSTLLTDVSITLAAGQLFLQGGTISDAGGGLLTISGGTAGGSLTGTGTIAVPVQNEAWCEPKDGPMTMQHGYTQASTGNLLLAASSATGKGPVTVQEGATIAGSLWVTK
jgi:hypothetical protein